MNNIIGLFGQIGTGKSTVSNYLQDKGWDYINQDKLGHQVLNDYPEELISIFGNQITTNGAVDRKKISDLVFNNPTMLQKLVDFSYPIITQKTIDLTTNQNTIIEGAFFYRVREQIPHSHLMYISVEHTLLHSRLLGRGHTKEWIDNVLNLDSQQDILKNQHLADITLDNNQDLTYLYQQIDSFLSQI